MSTSPLVGHLGGLNYFQSLKIPPTTNCGKWAAYAKAKGLAGHKDKPLTNDPMEATYIGIYMWKQAVEKPIHRHRQSDRAMAGHLTFKAPSGFMAKMDEKNHHLHKAGVYRRNQSRY